jgi:hypothetical protein
MFFIYPVIPSIVHFPILSSSHTFIFLSCHSLTRSFSYSVILSHVHFLSCHPLTRSFSCSVILSHFLSPILSSKTHSFSYPVILSHVHFPIMSSSHTFIFLSCHPTTRSFSYPVILPHVHFPILSSSNKFIFLSCLYLTFLILSFSLSQLCYHHPFMIYTLSHSINMSSCAIF